MNDPNQSHREMTLGEFVGTLPNRHPARIELAQLRNALLAHANSPSAHSRQPPDAAVLEYQRDVLRLIAKQVDAAVAPLIERLGEAHAALLKAEVVLSKPVLGAAAFLTRAIETSEAMRRAALDAVRSTIEDIESDNWWEGGEDNYDPTTKTVTLAGEGGECPSD